MTRLALFPLGTVLFPDGRLGLRVFEPRYLDMVSRCLRKDGTFGVCLVREGSEAGAVARPHAVGTEAHIVDWDRDDEGLLELTVHGRRRFRILDTRVQPDNLLLGEVEWLPEPPLALPAEYAPLAELLWQLLQRVEPDRARAAERFSEAAWVGYRLAECLPLQPEQAQTLLAQDDPLLRLQALAAVIRAIEAAGGG